MQTRKALARLRGEGYLGTPLSDTGAEIILATGPHGFPRGWCDARPGTPPEARTWRGPGTKEFASHERANSRAPRSLLLMNEPISSAPQRVLFVCVENSNRSQMAEAFARLHGNGRVEAYSAGSRPSGRVNPRRRVHEGGRLRPDPPSVEGVGRGRR